MADQMSGYDGEIDWEAEIIAADLAALQRAEREQSDNDNQGSNFGKRKIPFVRKLGRKQPIESGDEENERTFGLAGRERADAVL